eukprot:SAG31_NODE_13949_length_835_cov_1.798913_1_plen_80_part_00
MFWGIICASNGPGVPVPGAAVRFFLCTIPTPPYAAALMLRPRFERSLFFERSPIPRYKQYYYGAILNVIPESMLLLGGA